MPTPTIKLPITGDYETDLLLTQEPLALLIGMILDQQVSMELAFRGPAVLRDRLGGELSVETITALSVTEFVQLCCEKPAIHRFPAAMGERIYRVCEHLAEHYGGDASKIWLRARSAEVVAQRLRDLPGFGEEKTKIFMALLAKRFGRRPKGWEVVAHPFSDNVPRSVADVRNAKTLGEVREWKRAMKAARKSKQDD